MKKKLAVSTLAVSMAAASFAGFPFSSEGLAKQLGFTTGVASAAASKSEVEARIQKIYDNLSSGQALYDYKIQAAGITQPEFEAIFASILGKLETKGTIDRADVKTSYDLFQTASSVVYDVYATGNTGVIKDKLYVDKNVALLNKLAKQAGVDNLTFDDVSEFFFGANGVEAELRTLLGKSTSELLAADKDLLKQAITNVLNRRVGTVNPLTVSEVVYKLDLTTDDIHLALSNFDKKLPTARKAGSSLISAYLKAFPLTTPVDPGTPGSGGGGGGGGTVVTTPVSNPVVVNAQGIYDVSKLVQILNGKATLKLVDADVIKAFDALVAANAGKTGLTLTLNLGTVNATTVDVPLSKAIIEAAKAKGIANIAITFNGLTVTIPVGQFSDAVTLTVSTLADSTITSVSKLKLASSVYEFDLTVGGVATTTFKQPITIKLPLKNTEGLDKELLSVTKLVYDKLQFEGGVVDGEYIVEPRDTFSSYAVVENKVTFTDIASVQSWAGKQIAVVAAKGAIEGVGSDKFAPKSNVTRAEFSKMLIRALNLENNSAVQSFTDVSSTAWYAPYVAVAAEKGIITGRGNSKFDPNATITRAEMATMISRALKSIKPDVTTGTALLSQFSDAGKIAASLRDGVAFAASNNLVIGNAGKFNPNNTATRAEAAVIIYRTINFK